jgi:Mg2+/Co2+ transporter CorC
MIRGLEVEVLEADERRIIRLRVKKAPQAQTEDELKESQQAQTT